MKNHKLTKPHSWAEDITDRYKNRLNESSLKKIKSEIKEAIDDYVKKSEGEFEHSTYHQ